MTADNDHISDAIHQLSDRRLRSGSITDIEVSTEINAQYPDLTHVSAELAYSSVHDVYVVESLETKYAFKLYRIGVRTKDEIQWEAALHNHLYDNNVSVPKLISSKAGFVATVTIGGESRLGVLSEWVKGKKPQASNRIYTLLGSTAAKMHEALDSFTLASPKPAKDFHSEVEQYLELLKPLLKKYKKWDDAINLADNISSYLVRHNLETGICHNDLTLDNIHETEQGLTVFDFDSSTVAWRASEGQGVFHFSKSIGETYWESWLAGYRKVRAMSSQEEQAVPYFVALFWFENTAWKLGLTPTSAGRYLQDDELPDEVNKLMNWAKLYFRD